MISDSLHRGCGSGGGVIFRRVHGRIARPVQPVNVPPEAVAEGREILAQLRLGRGQHRGEMLKVCGDHLALRVRDSVERA